MGIKDLSKWIAKTHPQVIQTFPERWASPGIKGSRIAIDATLLTNRFHFAITDGELKGKGSLIGWYNLINEMRAHDIKPIAVWDRPGTRAWKFGENKRRWITRGLNYARKTHEEKREERLVSLKEALETMERMEQEEQGAVRDHLIRMGLIEGSRREMVAANVSSAPLGDGAVAGHAVPVTRDKPTSPIHDLPHALVVDNPAPPVSAAPSPTSGTPDELEPLERIANMVDTLTSHVTSYRESLQTPEISLFPTQTVLEEALERVKELEDLYESLDEEDVRMRPAPKTGTPLLETAGPSEAGPSVGDEGLGAVNGQSEGGEKMHEALRLERERERDQEWLAEKMSELMPPSLFSETRRQAAMSVEEGRILEAFLGVTPPTPLPALSLPTSASSATVERIPPLDPGIAAEPQIDNLDPLLAIDPLRRLDDLLEAVPATKAIYERALGQPNKHTYTDCQDLLHRMGVPVIMAEAPYEAEGLATALTKAGLADWVASEDSDVIPLGGPQLRNVSTHRQHLCTTLTPLLLSSLSFTHSQLIEFCILLGNDAVPRIRKVGPVKAFKLITDHFTIEAALAAEPKIRQAAEEEMPGYLEMVKTARAVFGQLPEITEEIKVKIVESGALVGPRPGDEGDAGRDWQEAEDEKGRGGTMQDVERWLEEKHGVAFVDVGAMGRVEEYEG